jgi:hypothetical protein
MAEQEVEKGMEQEVEKGMPVAIALVMVVARRPNRLQLPWKTLTGLHDIPSQSRDRR